MFAITVAKNIVLMLNLVFASHLAFTDFYLVFTAGLVSLYRARATKWCTAHSQHPIAKSCTV